MGPKGPKGTGGKRGGAQGDGHSGVSYASPDGAARAAYLAAQLAVPAAVSQGGQPVLPAGALPLGRTGSVHSLRGPSVSRAANQPPSAPVHYYVIGSVKLS